MDGVTILIFYCHLLYDIFKLANHIDRLTFCLYTRNHQVRRATNNILLIFSWSASQVENQCYQNVKAVKIKHHI